MDSRGHRGKATTGREHGKAPVRGAAFSKASVSGGRASVTADFTIYEQQGAGAFTIRYRTGLSSFGGYHWADRDEERRKILECINNDSGVDSAGSYLTAFDPETKTVTMLHGDESLLAEWRDGGAPGAAEKVSFERDEIGNDSPCDAREDELSDDNPFGARETENPF